MKKDYSVQENYDQSKQGSADDDQLNVGENDDQHNPVEENDDQPSSDKDKDIIDVKERNLEDDINA